MNVSQGNLRFTATPWEGCFFIFLQYIAKVGEYWVLYREQWKYGLGFCNFQLHYMLKPAYYFNLWLYLQKKTYSNWDYED